MVNHSKARQQRFWQKWAATIQTIDDAKVERLILSAENRDRVQQRLSAITEAGIFTINIACADVPPPLSATKFQYRIAWPESRVRACEEKCLMSDDIIMIRITQKRSEKFLVHEEGVDYLKSGDVVYFTKDTVSFRRIGLDWEDNKEGLRLKHKVYQFKLLSAPPYSRKSTKRHYASWRARMDFTLDEAQCAT